MTRSLATLRVSARTYGEVERLLWAAGYGYAFVDGAIEMHGIGLVRSGPSPTSGKGTPMLPTSEEALPVIEAVLADPKVRQARAFTADGKAIVRATRLFKAQRRETGVEIRLTLGRPNVDEVAESKKLRKANATAEEFRTVRTRPWPKATKKVVAGSPPPKRKAVAKKATVRSRR